MENFLTWDMLLTWSGCVAGTIILTEFVKKLAPKAMPQIVSFIFAVMILALGHFAVGDFAWKEAPLYLINAIAVSIAANGGFDLLNRIFGKTAVVNNELYVTPGEEGTDVYMSVNDDPDTYEDGELLTFKVVKKNSQK